MSSDPLRRLENDLAVMRAAIGDDLPFDRSHAVLQLLTGAFGLPLLLLPLFGLDAYVLQGILVFDGLLSIAWLWQYRSTEANRFQRPLVWRTARLEIFSSLLIGGLLAAFFAWLTYLGSHLPDWNERFTNFVVPTTFFLLGVVGIAWVSFDRRRWPNLTWVVGLMLMGVIAPLCKLRSQNWMLYGSVILVAGLVAGMLELHLLSRRKATHAD